MREKEKNAPSLPCPGQAVLLGLLGGLFALWMLLCVSLSLTNLQCDYFWAKKLPLALTFAAALVFLFLVGKLFACLPAPSAKNEKLLVTGFFLLYLCGLSMSAWKLGVNPNQSWDFGSVYSQAEAYVEKGTVAGDYFLLYNNNRPLFALEVLYFRFVRLLGVQNLLTAGAVLNVFCIALSVFLTYFILRRLAGVRTALFGLAACAVCAGLWGYAPVVYTDTLTMPFPAAAGLLWLHARERLQQGGRRKGLFLCAAAGAVVAAGATLKFTVLIVLIAIAIDALILCKGRDKVLSLLCAAAGFALCFLLLKAGVATCKGLPAYDREAAVPHTHWVMMGLNGSGGYNNEDYQQTLGVEGWDARVDMNLSVIRQRLAAMGPLGLLSHLGDKISYAWGDGAYYAPVKLNRGAQNRCFLREWMIPDGKYIGLTWYTFTGLHLAALAFAGAGMMAQLKRRRFDGVFISTAVLGLGLFLLIWENRSRYLVNMLPLLLAVLALGMNALFGWEKRDAAGQGR